MSKFRTISHIYAVIAAAIGGFLVTPAGQAVLAQYPRAASVIASVSTIAAIYHQSKKK